MTPWSSSTTPARPRQPSARRGVARKAACPRSTPRWKNPDTAAEKELVAKRLWLEPLSDYVSLHELTSVTVRFPPDQQKRDLSILVGELDDPANQRKLPLLVSLQNDGNIALYGDANSGIEEVAASMLMNASSATLHLKLNVYVLDFGGGMLTAFRGAPQVGDVVIANDEERVRRLFRFLSQELDRRRCVLASVGGSYTCYVAQGNVCPRVLLPVINGMAIFNELYEKQEPQLVKLLREGASVGIHAILGAMTVQDIRMRLRACVKSSLVFSLASEGDYMNLLGSLRGVALPDGLGRGLIRRGDGIHMFQSAGVASRADGDCTEQSRLSPRAWGQIRAERLRLQSQAPCIADVRAVRTGARRAGRAHRPV